MSRDLEMTEGAATVLDQHFDDIITEPIEAHASYSGKPLMEYLRANAESITD